MGLIACNCLGEVLQQNVQELDSEVNMNDESLDQMLIDGKTKTELHKLIEMKQTAVQNEDYEEAKILKLKIDRFKLVIGQIMDLEKAKTSAVQDED